MTSETKGASIDDVKMLSAEFDKSDIHWRSQSLTKDGSKALALAYLDSRNVQDRLDSVVGMENWQNRFEVHGNKTICYLSININGEWIAKADGAGDTAVEAEKGSLSDAFKRAAVQWGIGRYLYAMGAPWVPCSTYERGGKLHFSEFTADPWDYVKGMKKPVSATEKKRKWQTIKAPIANELLDVKTLDDLRKLFADYQSVMQSEGLIGREWKSCLEAEFKSRANELTPKEEPNILMAG